MTDCLPTFGWRHYQVRLAKGPETASAILRQSVGCTNHRLPWPFEKRKGGYLTLCRGYYE